MIDNPGFDGLPVSDQTSQDFLTSYASRAQYFTPPTGKEVIVVYLKAEPAPNPFNKGKTNLVRYHVVEDGQLKFWDRPGKALASIMSKFKPHTTLSILKTGEKTETKYAIKEVSP